MAHDYLYVMKKGGGKKRDALVLTKLRKQEKKRSLILE